MTYFEKLPAIYYDYNIGNENVVKVIRDVSTNLRFVKSTLNDITLFDEYDIPDGFSPEQVSEQVYGTPYYHVVIMLLNDIHDVVNDWPLNSTQLSDYVTFKYGAGNEYATHHYENHNGRTLTSVDKYRDPNVAPVTLDCTMSAYTKSLTSVVADAFDAILDYNTWLVTGIGVPADTYVETIDTLSALTLTNETSQSITTECTFVSIVDPMLNTVAVSNFEYENLLNENKRRIKLLHPTLMPNVIKQIDAALNQ